MREIVMPEVKLPDIKLPEGLREMSRDDIVQAAQDARSNMHMPRKIDISRKSISRRSTSPGSTSRRSSFRNRSATGCRAGVVRTRCSRLPGSWRSGR